MMKGLMKMGMGLVWNDCLCMSCLLDGASCGERRRAVGLDCCLDCCHPTFENLQSELWSKLSLLVAEEDAIRDAATHSVGV